MIMTWVIATFAMSGVAASASAAGPMIWGPAHQLGSPVTSPG
jgi:hypothetical protein